VRFETAPGKQLQIDFGERLVEIAGRKVKLFLFVGTLGYSRRTHVRAFRHERQEAPNLQARARSNPSSERRFERASETEVVDFGAQGKGQRMAPFPFGRQLYLPFGKRDE
jgi:hypothetical protein